MVTTLGKRIGLLGGSFNPAHEGHLYISQVAIAELGLDAVWWLVAPKKETHTRLTSTANEKRTREC